ncbi:MAG: hypothetical protein Q4E46_01455 [Candidatus Saccharibacteria bacterium]|nr:hypothetical protein [Candidatus Saccharibacteria bacterium]
MSQFVNTNDLQQAIDEVANASAPQPEVDAIKDQLGVPPMPPAFDEVAPAVAPVAEAAPAPAPVAPAPEPVVAAPAPAPAPAPVAPAVAPATNDLGAVKTEALRELVPLIDRVNLPAEQKFGIVTDVIAATGDKSIAGNALAAARGITDENVKAESLLKLVQMIDN